MARRVEGKVAFITGSASGLGRATAQLLAAEGAKVIIADINEEKGQATAAEIGASAKFVKLDVANEQNWDDAMAEAQAAFGTINVLVNSAGISVPATIEDASFDHWRQLMSINLDGTFLGCRAGVKAMRENGGSIINMASAMGKKASPEFPAYGATKSAIIHLTKCIALHCGQARLPIRCNTVAPGAIHTEMFDVYLEEGMAAGATEEQVMKAFSKGHMAGRIGRPEEVANLILFLASDESSFCTGSDYAVDSGLAIS